jgi:hypothetical protein
MGREWVTYGVPHHQFYSIQYMGNLHDLLNNVAQEWMVFEVQKFYRTYLGAYRNK